MMKETRIFYNSIILLASVGKNAAFIQGRLLFLVFTKFMLLLIKGGFYYRAASIQENTVVAFTCIFVLLLFFLLVTRLANSNYL